jgi:hypothetical protein
MPRLPMLMVARQEPVELRESHAGRLMRARRVARRDESMTRGSGGNDKPSPAPSTSRLTGTICSIG